MHEHPPARRVFTVHSQAEFIYQIDVFVKGKTGAHLSGVCAHKTIHTHIPGCQIHYSERQVSLMEGLTSLSRARSGTTTTTKSIGKSQPRARAQIVTMERTSAALRAGGIRGREMGVDVS